MYLTENTSQAASVRVVRLRQTTRARSRLRKFVGKARKGFFDSLSRLFRGGLFSDALGTYTNPAPALPHPIHDLTLGREDNIPPLQG